MHSPSHKQAPSKPKSPTGEMAAYYLQMQVGGWFVWRLVGAGATPA